MFAIGFVVLVVAAQGDAPKPTTIEEHVKVLDDTVWKNERLAQRYEVEFIVDMWDRLRAAKDPFEVFKEVAFKTITLGSPVSSEDLGLDISVQKFGAPTTSLNSEQWKKFVASFKDKGYVIEHTDWHHAGFRVDANGTAHSEISCRIDVSNTKLNDRTTLEGTLVVEWENDAIRPKSIDASSVRVKQRPNSHAFSDPWTLQSKDLRPPSQPKLVFKPTMVYDVNGDGLPEIIAAGMSLMLMNRGGGQMQPVPMVDGDLVYMLSAVIGDFTGDGVPDMLGGKIADSSIVLLPGIKGKGFSSKEIPVFEGEPVVKGPECITAGDIDGDGDLDAWIGQWKYPYSDQMPARYFDANDGFPSYLLVNQGGGKFVDGTKAAGLGEKRLRRTYSASFVDLDDDGDLDLMTVNDFAGIDLHHNDGKGHFTDVTKDKVDEPHNFGMSHTIADYDLDGKLDLFVQGMSSTTARRLDRMEAGRSNLPEHNRMRSVMGYGNRMYLGKGNGKYQQPSFKDQVARTGWSWGSTSLDFDNDSDMDLFVANGHLSGKSTKDYCTSFWCHDIYLPSDESQKGNSVQNFLNSKLQKTITDISWDGFQPNRLLVNGGGKGFVDVGHLMRVGQEYDSRSAVSADFDGDGWVDLMVQWDNQKLGQYNETMMIMQNHLGRSLKRNWIGVHLADGPGSVGNHGAKVRIGTAAGERVGVFVSGDSYHCQHPNTRHFGLGETDKVDFLEITWSDGKKKRIDGPAVNKYHTVAHPDAG